MGGGASKHKGNSEEFNQIRRQLDEVTGKLTDLSKQLKQDSDNKQNQAVVPGASPVPAVVETTQAALPTPAEAADQIVEKKEHTKLITKGMANAPALGILRLDYDYPAAPGDIDHPDTYGYDVYFRVVPGLTFEMCQYGIMTEVVEEKFVEAIKWLVEEKKVVGITGDCGFMMYFQELARKHTTVPVFMSSLVHLAAVEGSFSAQEQIAIFTANSETLEPMHDLIKQECGIDMKQERLIIVGCQDVPGFEAVALGEKVDVKAVTPGIIQKAKDILEKYPLVRAILSECTELPPYSDALRAELKIPVYDAITQADFFMSGRMDNKRFGVQFQKKWDGRQDTYHFAQHLTEKEDRELLVNA